MVSALDTKSEYPLPFLFVFATLIASVAFLLALTYVPKRSRHGKQDAPIDGQRAQSAKLGPPTTYYRYSHK